ncbi:A/G-specific adenine glycosylase [Sedimentitalea sp. JM2-8]|uniref:Adenine DNA glycosylase n=1 Tax=Sedimentitalea xiamensis TaxID=3050037 RepID=A0ABT7F931_9RHOB|nr:A/G-specific adenine glycosylase [Sedimentitalea xiamensis]MDK3071601.1 A/G-specific adenine glycosylase [Sedimentitalea xiamensis]
MRDGQSIETDIATTMLDWYDRHARDLPWRTSAAELNSGARPDPYRVWLSEIMLQQTTVAAVRDYFHRFTTRWPTVDDLAAAPDGAVMGEWAGLGYYARARNLLKCARIVAEEHGGRFPDRYDDLIALPGIGPYTAAAISAIAFDRPETVMDGNVERVAARLYDIHTPLPAAKSELKARAELLTPRLRPGDYAQAMMDLGATICTPKSPACGICPLQSPCAARRAGTAPELPRKMPKTAKPTRRGIVYLACRADGAWLMERRPDKGLLGGMLGWPGSDWKDGAAGAPPVSADWSTLAAEVRHTFTHFHLVLTVRTATVDMGCAPETGFFIPNRDFRPSELPTVMRKAFDLCRER